MRCRAGATERGSATVLAVVIVGLLGLVATTGAALSGLLVAQRRVAAAADLSALAGAVASQHGEPVCPAVTVVARRNGARVERCKAVGETVTVEAVLERTSLFGRSVSVRARARAGPDTSIGRLVPVPVDDP